MTKDKARRQTREKILQALQRLGVLRERWPMFLQLPCGPQNRQLLRADPFQPPPFDRLHDTSDDWAKEADEAWHKHLATQLHHFQFWESTGIYPPVETAKRSRGARKATSRRRGLTVEQRFEAAALRLVGEKWETITATLNEATRHCPDVGLSTVKKAVAAVFESAGWYDKRGDFFPRTKYHLSGGAQVIVYDSDQEHSLEKESPGCWSDKPPTPFEALKLRIRSRLQYRAQERQRRGDRIPIPD